MGAGMSGMGGGMDPSGMGGPGGMMGGSGGTDPNSLGGAPDPNAAPGGAPGGIGGAVQSPFMAPPTAPGTSGSPDVSGAGTPPSPDVSGAGTPPSVPVATGQTDGATTGTAGGTMVPPAVTGPAFPNPAVGLGGPGSMSFQPGAGFGNANIPFTGINSGVNGNAGMGSKMGPGMGSGMMVPAMTGQTGWGGPQSNGNGFSNPMQGRFHKQGWEDNEGTDEMFPSDPDSGNVFNPNPQTTRVLSPLKGKLIETIPVEGGNIKTTGDGQFFSDGIVQESLEDQVNSVNI